VLVAAAALALPYVVGPLYRNDASLVADLRAARAEPGAAHGLGRPDQPGQFGFLGIGAAVGGGLAADTNADFFVAVFAAGAVGAVMAVLIGIPALRMPGLYLAVTTLAFAATTSAFFLNRDYFGWVLPEPENQVLRPVLYGRVDVSATPPSTTCAWPSSCRRALAAGDAAQPDRARPHRLARQPAGGAGLRRGAGAGQARAFAMSGFLAAVAGALFAYQQGAVDQGSFPVINSLAVFAMVVVGGLSRPMGAVLGALYLVGLERVPGLRDIELVQLLTTGVGLIVLLLLLPGGFTAAVLNVRDDYLRRVAARRGIDVPSLNADRLQAQPEEEVHVPEVRRRRAAHSGRGAGGCGHGHGERAVRARLAALTGGASATPC
jgi:branched-chain amino acid transport system permease protein